MKKKFTIIYSLIAVAVLCAFEGVVALCCAPGLRSSAAIDLEDENFITIGEIHALNEINSFANVRALYDAISGESNTTLADIKTLAATVGGYNAASMRAHNDNKDIRVQFGGYIWHVVYLSQTMEDNPRPILTLWLADDQGIPKSSWSSGWCNLLSSDGTDTLYPSSLYGTSYMRAVTLNNGGQYAMDSQGRTKYVSGGVVLSENVTPDANHVFKKFTVSTAENAVINDDEIVTPSLVKWQKDEQNAKTRFGEGSRLYRLNNENWDDSNNSDDWYSDTLYYDKADNRCHDVYANWNTDNLWLPSLSEIGYYTSNNSNAGLWGLSENQMRSSDWAWLRSGSGAYNVYFLTQFGGNFGRQEVFCEMVVRPALHINLDSDSLATDEAWYVRTNGQTIETDYDGTDKIVSFVKAQAWFDATTMTVAESNITTAGEHTVHIVKGERTSTTTLKINPKPITATFSYTVGNPVPSVTLNGIITGDTVTPIIVYQRDGAVVTKPTNTSSAGTYTMTVTGLTGANAANYELAGNNTFTFPIATTIYDFAVPYTGEVYDLTTVAPWYEAGMTITTSPAQVKKAGTYDVTVTKDGQTQTATLTVTKKQLTVALTAGGWNVGDDVKLPTATLSDGIATGDTVTTAQTYYNENDDVIADITKATAGAYYVAVTLNGADAANYELVGKTTKIFAIKDVVTTGATPIAGSVENSTINTWVMTGVAGGVGLGALFVIIFAILNRRKSRLSPVAVG